MKRFLGQRKWRKGQETKRGDQLEPPATVELLSWRKSSSFAARFFSRNQNAFGHHPSQANENSPSNEFISNNAVESHATTDSNSLTTITRRSSKPTRQDSSTLPTAETRQRQQDRYNTYQSCLEENPLYSMMVSSAGIQCISIDCPPSLYHASYPCQTNKSNDKTDTVEDLPLMHDQTIKANVSYLSLTNLSGLIDHEPNVSRRNSLSRSTSHLSMHKPSSFLVDIFQKMTYEQRAKSISQLAQLHENLTKSITGPDQLNRTTSLPNLSKKPRALASATSLLSEPASRTNKVPLEDQTMTISSNNEKLTIDSKVFHSDSIKTTNDRHLSDSNISAKPSDKEIPKDVSPVKLRSHPSVDQDVQCTTCDAIFPSESLTDASNASQCKRKKAMGKVDEKDLSLNQPMALDRQPPSITKTTEQATLDSLSHHSQSLSTLNEQAEDAGQQSVSSHSEWNDPISHEKDLPTMTRINTASTNLIATNEENDDDEQSKLINEQLKRSSLGLARDSLELLRYSHPMHDTSSERLISPKTLADDTPHQRKSVLKSRPGSADDLPTPELVSYVAIDDMKGDKRLVEKQMRRHSLTVGGSTVVSCTSPKPKRDSLVLLQERFSGLITPGSGCHHLSNADSRHVEFIREPGDTVTPALHIGRGIQLKNSSSKPISPSISSHPFDLSERSKSDMSIPRGPQRIDTSSPMRSRRHSFDDSSVHQPISQMAAVSASTTALFDLDRLGEEQVCLYKSDYDQMVRLILTPLSKKKKHPIRSVLETNVELRIIHRLSTLQNLMLLVFLISFYLFIFIRSHYWHEYQ